MRQTERNTGSRSSDFSGPSSAALVIGRDSMFMNMIVSCMLLCVRIAFVCTV